MLGEELLVDDVTVKLELAGNVGRGAMLHEGEVVFVERQTHSSWVMEAASVPLRLRLIRHSAQSVTEVPFVKSSH